VQGVSFGQIRSGLTVEAYELTVHGLCDRCQDVESVSS
jgi:Fe2+ or Zn2+ uptake regulation protein